MTAEERAKLQRRYQGKLNKVQGANFEQIIEGGCDFYRRHEIADIERRRSPCSRSKTWEAGSL